MGRLERLVSIIGETIREQGADGAPSGVIYAGLMGHCGYTEYNAIIAALKKAGHIKERNHVLYWVGKTSEPQAG